MAKRILIADDSVTIQKAFAMTFAGADDVTVSGARTADEGLSLAQRTHPDLVIADGVMPGRSGYDLCASIKADPTLRAVPVLILASTQQPYDDARGQKAGADGQLTKPWETNAMMDRVRDILRRGAGAAAGPQPAAAPAAPAPAHRSAASLPTAAIDDDEYGEISIDTGRDSIPTIPRAATAAPAPAPSSGGRISSPSMPAMPAAPAAHAPPPAPPPAAHPHPPASAGSSPGMRPSLIPGMRPGAMPPARPGTVPARPTGPVPTGAPPRPMAQPIGRTLMGVPAANIPIPGVMRPSIPSMPAVGSAPPPAPPPRHATGAAAPMDARARIATPPPRQRIATPPPPARPSISPAAHASVAASVEQKLAAISAKGPEYEAIAKLSREIIEQVVWEVVPELAEAIIREHMEKRGRA
ncbi:MAG TPA: response regulator [Polyangia bacterium]|nr:response regulator [Polyangia bacterium]